MIVKDKDVRLNPDCKSTVVFDNHIEIPIKIDDDNIDYLSSMFGVRKRGGVVATLLIPRNGYEVNINDYCYIHILDSYIRRTDNYNKFIDGLFKSKNYRELSNVAKPCDLSVLERIEILANFIPLAN